MVESLDATQDCRDISFPAFLHGGNLAYGQARDFRLVAAAPQGV